MGICDKFHLLKLQRLQSKVLCTTGNPKHTLVQDMHTAFHMPYVYDYKTKSCRQAEVIQNHENVRYIGQAKPDTENIRGLNLAAVMCMTVQVTK
jgi:hypothetical protein